MSRTFCRGLATLVGYAVLAPAFAAYALRVVSFETVAKGLSLIPGLGGMWLRRLWYRHTLTACGEKLYVDFLAAIRTPKTRIGHHVYLGVACWVGWAEIGDDVMLGGHIVVLSGLAQHTFERLDAGGAGSVRPDWPRRVGGQRSDHRRRRERRHRRGGGQRRHQDISAARHPRRSTGSCRRQPSGEHVL